MYAMKFSIPVFPAALLVAFLVPPVQADQPIMNMMPRWNGGWGVQGLYEHTHNPRLLKGRRTVDADLEENIHRFHLEGVYTWSKELRVTLKVPFVLDAEREVMRNGERVVERDQGIGDATLALPIKRYFNEDGYSGSWSVVPQVRIPLDFEDDGYEVYDGQWGNGLFLGYEVESTKHFLATGVSGWTFYGDEESEFHGHLDLGRNFLDRGQALIETDFHAENDGTRTLMTGPALYWRFTDVIHTRLEWKQAIYDDQGSGEADHGDGSMLKAGIGFVF